MAIRQEVGKQKDAQDPLSSSSVSRGSSSLLLLPLHPVSSVKKAHDHSPVLTDIVGALNDILSLHGTVAEQLHISKKLKGSWILI